jgi:nucleoside-diphosphate-sugar epimerase
MNPWLHDPPGLPVPVREDAPLVAEPGEDEKGYRIARTEELVFQLHPGATHFRYPYVYGPYQLVPREWSIVRRVLDGRRRIVVADDGLTLHHHGYTENLAHAMLLSLAQPDRAAGRVYNVGDDEVLSVRQVVELVAAALGHELEVVSLPYDLAAPAWPLLAQPLPTHRVLDLARIRQDLDYRDAVPARTALAHTAHWLAEHPPDPGGMEETVLTDPFDYAAEDALVDAWTRDGRRARFASSPGFDPPGYGLAYSGPGGRPRSSETFESGPESETVRGEA